MRFMQSIRLDDGCSIILEPFHEGNSRNYRNLKKMKDDNVIWKAELPTRSFQDAFVSFELIDGSLWANTWECYRCEISIHDGRVLYEEFTK